MCHRFDGRGRNEDCSSPPAQIPACATNAPGSSLGSNVRRRAFGHARRPAHNRQSDRCSSPALCPDCSRLTVVSLGPGPSLPVLRRELPLIVRTLLRYYGPVRLLTRVHVRRAASSLPEPARTEVRARMRSPRFRTKGRLHVHEVSDCARSDPHLPSSRMDRCCLLFNGTRSAPRNSTRFAAQYSAHGRPCERFAAGLATRTSRITRGRSRWLDVTP